MYVKLYADNRLDRIMLLRCCELFISDPTLDDKLGARNGVIYTPDGLEHKGWHGYIYRTQTAVIGRVLKGENNGA